MDYGYFPKDQVIFSSVRVASSERERERERETERERGRERDRERESVSVSVSVSLKYFSAAGSIDILLFSSLLFCILSFVLVFFSFFWGGGLFLLRSHRGRRRRADSVCASNIYKSDSSLLSAADIE